MFIFYAVSSWCLLPVSAIMSVVLLLASNITSVRGFFFVRHAVNLRPIDSLLTNTTNTPRCDGFHYCIARVLRDTHTFSLCSCFDFFEFLRSQQDLYPTRLAIGGGLVVRVCCAFFCHALSIPHLYYLYEYTHFYTIFMSMLFTHFYTNFLSMLLTCGRFTGIISRKSFRRHDGMRLP